MPGSFESANWIEGPSCACILPVQLSMHLAVKRQRETPLSLVSHFPSIIFVAFSTRRQGKMPQ